MGITTKLKISRFDPGNDTVMRLQEYVIHGEERQSVLQSLFYIYEQIDSTVAFRFGCRFKHCGLCGMEINGMPRLACLTELKEGMVLEPLKNLPVLRDLAIDRGLFFESLKKLELYIPSDDNISTPQIIFEPKQHERLAGCAECLICLAQCRYYTYSEMSFGGPYLFVKLAMLHMDPRDKVNRLSQAKALGIERCRHCQECHIYCPMGINIYRDAIQPFLAEP